MFKFGVRNLRRLRDASPIEIRPITILVGRNSSGKSSFLRSLPLLRQSVMTRTSSPILWYGDLVDFGSFHGVISDNDPTLSLSFSFHLDDVSFGSRGLVWAQGGYYTTPSGSYRSVSFDVSISGPDDTARIDQIVLSVEDGASVFTLKVEPNGNVRSIHLDGTDILPYYRPASLVVQQTSIFPEIALTSDTPSGPNEVFFGRPEATFYKSLADLIAPHLDKRMKRPAVESLALALLSQESMSKEALLSYGQDTHVRSWRKLLNEIATKDKNSIYPKIEHLFLAHRFLPLVRGVTESLRSIVSDILYIGPARAGSERYYRYQDLSVSEIDPNGNNFPMFLNSLPEWQVNDLSDWVERLFGYRVTTSKSSGHISINVIEGDSETNLVDTGYGVSQILPVLGQIWWSGNRERSTQRSQRRRQVSILAIEQPELHLHPAHQAMLADALVDNPARSSRAASSGRTHFVVETHSETLINRLGELISEKRLSAEDVQIVLFEPDPEGARRTDVRIARFGADGELINWPYGFFQPSI